MENAAVFAGFGQYQVGYEPSRPPFLPIALSLLFRITGPNAYDAYLLSGFLYFLSILGGYLLARQIMNPFLAIVPAVSYGVVPMVIMWEGIMYSNVEGVAIAALALATLAFSTKEGKSRYYMLAIPLLLIAPLTRFTMGTILAAAIVYLLASGNLRRTFTDRYFFYGLAIAVAIGLALSFPWIEYTLLLGYPVTNMFPSPSELNPFQSSLGRAFFPLNFPNELGMGIYGYVITGLLVLCFVYCLARVISSVSSGREKNASGIIQVTKLNWSRASNSAQGESEQIYRRRKNAMILAIFTWFVSLFLYYTLLWPYDDLRYSIEFILPALILSYFFIGEVLNRLYSHARRSSSKLTSSASIAVIVIILVSMIFLAAQSGLLVNQNTPVVDTGISSGMRQATAWVKANVPSSAKIEADWYTFGRWYLPGYNVSVAPAAYQLQTAGDYQGWQNTISANHIGYVIYSNPSEINVPSNFHAVFTSTYQEIVVYQVSG